MNWRRGLIIAGVHLVVSASLIVSVLVPRYETEKIRSEISGATLQLAAYQEDGQTVSFSPICEEWRSQLWQEKVLVSSELPAAILSGWNSDCPPRWTTAGLIGIDIRHHSWQKRAASSAAFCLLIAIQWLLIGGPPFDPSAKMVA